MDICKYITNISKLKLDNNSEIGPLIVGSHKRIDLHVSNNLKLYHFIVSDTVNCLIGIIIVQKFIRCQLISIERFNNYKIWHLRIKNRLKKEDDVFST